MKHEAIDPRRERLVAYLYGELSEAESRDFRALLSTDPALAKEFDEMRGTRELLSGWDVLEPTPTFVFVDEPAARRAPRVPGWRMLLAPFTLRGFGGFGLGLGVAGAAALLIAVSGFRIDRVDGGLAFRFGPRGSAAPVHAERTPAGLGAPLELASGRGGAPAMTAPPIASAGGDPNEVLTRAEFDKLAGQMLGSIVDILNEYDDRQNLEMNGVLHAMYERIADRQYRESEDLRQRMNALGVELLVRQTRGEASRADGAIAPASLDSRQFENPLRPVEWKEEWR